jgi:hypothetical protein
MAFVTAVLIGGSKLIIFLFSDLIDSVVDLGIACATVALAGDLLVREKKFSERKLIFCENLHLVKK